MHFVVPGEGEASAHVVHNAWGLIGLEVLDESVINGLLESSALRGDSLLLVFVEYVSALGLGGLVFEGCISDLGGIGSGDVDFGTRSNSVNLVNAFEGHSVNFEGTANEKKTRLELLEEDDSLATISAGSKDEHATGLNTLSKLGGIRFLSANLTFLVLCRVPIELFDH